MASTPRKAIIVFFLSLFLFSMFAQSALAAGEKTVCAVFLTKTGCPYCENVEPFIEKVMSETPNFALIRYNLIDQQYNAPVFSQYISTYKTGPYYPTIIFGNDNFIIGDKPIMDQLKAKIAELGSNPCPLGDGSAVEFDQCNLSALSGKPEVFLGSKNLSLEGQCGVPVEKTKLTIAKILGLALADSVNPCEFAVLVLVLLAIISAHPGKRRSILLGGLAFTAAVFSMYLIYGLIIVRSMQFAQAIGPLKPILYKILAVVAVFLGLLNVKDYFHYKPGSVATEMPLSFRPVLKRLIGHVTSPKGAFFVGLFVTLFLLPCTAGPYIIAGGILSALEIIKTIPWLLIYNAVFVLPMIIITLIVYVGLAKVEDMSAWRDRHIKWMHLIAGILLALLGIAMFFGLL